MRTGHSVAPLQGLLSFWMISPEFRFAPLRALSPAHPPGAIPECGRNHASPPNAIVAFGRSNASPPGAIAGLSGITRRLRVARALAEKSSSFFQRRRREGVKPGVERSETPGNGGQQYSEPLPRGDGNAPRSKITFIKRQTMCPQNDLELLKEGNASMMFLLFFDVTTDLRRLRLTHRERAISFLPRESPGVFGRSRNPSGRIRFQLTDNFRNRFVLPQLRQNVHMIRRSINDHRDSVLVPDRTAEVLMNPRTDGRRQPWFTFLRRKHDVIEQIAIGGTHSDAPFRRPSSGASLFPNHTPGVSLRSTPGFIPPHPSGALIPGVPGFAWTSQTDLPDQRRRRGRLERGVQRSGTPGNYRLQIFKPLARGDGERVRISAFAPLK
jgi:hypothetical protein